MKLAKLLAGCGVFSLGVLMAASSSVTIVDPIWLGPTQLKPGDYKVQMEGNKVSLKMGKTVVEAPAKMEKNATKYQDTQFTTQSVNGKASLQEIDLGGSTSKIVINGSLSAAGTK